MSRLAYSIVKLHNLAMKARNREKMRIYLAPRATQEEVGRFTLQPSSS